MHLLEALFIEEMEVNHVDDIHEKLTDMVGDRVKVKANMGRTRVIERMGTIKSVHPAVFIVEVDERRGRKSRQSYQYIDVLTGQVELFDPESGAPIKTVIEAFVSAQLRAARDSGEATARSMRTSRRRSPRARAWARPTSDRGMSTCPW